MTTYEILNAAVYAKKTVCIASAQARNEALETMACALIDHTADILSANEKDIDAAKGNISNVMIDRLRLTEKRIADMAEGIRAVIRLPDPVGQTLTSYTAPNGLLIERKSVPFGVIAVIYESRPNVTSDAAALALKSGNVCVLRGGKEAYRSSRAVTDALREGLRKAGFCEDAVQLIEDLTRQSASDLMTAAGYVDLLVPRGGAGLIRACVENAKVPCLQTGTGICHIYVDKAADLDMAVNIMENAKTSRPSVCNAAEVCLVHKNVAEAFLPMLAKRLCIDRAAAGKVPVELRCDERAYAVIGGTKASDRDFDTEFLDYILGVKVVDSAEEAVAHIAAHSTGHSDCIVSADEKTVDLFTAAVDSAAVYVNASTRFTDGGEFGLGCEMGISTQKMHARGPVGIKELTTYKYIVRGNGQVR